MPMILLYLVQIVVLVVAPLLFVASLVAFKATSWLQLALKCLVAAAYLALVFSIGRWDIVGYWLRYAWPTLYVLAFAIAVYRARDALVLPRPRPVQLLWIGTNAVILGFFVLLLLQIDGADEPAGTPIALRFPLDDGRWYVAHGGAHEAVNAHHGVRAQRYAVDLTRLDNFGFRAAGLLPADLQDYAIFGDAVSAPCDGRILSVENGLPDLVPPQMDPENPAGNHVLLRCGDVIVLLAHLRFGSVVVDPGTHIQAGTALGTVGNSGQSSEPHLHIHAVRGVSPERDTISSEVLWSAEPVPMLFDGTFLLRNAIGDLATER